jgi:hypothetical protein
MSTATSFQFIDAFPLCVADDSSTFYYYVRNLTLQQVMSFYWNTETFTITTSASASGTYPPTTGTYYSGTANGTLTLSPLGVTGDFTQDVFSGTTGTNGWLKTTSSFDYSLGQNSTQPRSRVCYASTFTAPYALYLNGDDSTKLNRTFFSFYFVIAKDSVNTGKFCVGYYYDIRFGFSGSGLTQYNIAYRPTSSGNDFNSGTFQINGVTFPYYCSTDLNPSSSGFTTSGGTMTVTSSNYTY